MEREVLIQQLKQALHLAESQEVIEFEIGDTAFCFELEDIGG